MATNREFINAILFSGMLDALPPPQMNNFLKKASRISRSMYTSTKRLSEIRQLLLTLKS